MADGRIATLVHRLRRLAAGESAAAPADRELLDRFAAGRDEAAFAALVRRHGGLVFGLCRRLLSNHHDAEDAFQATFLVLAQKARAIRRREAVAGWLHQVGYRIAVKLRGDNARRRETGPPTETIDRADPQRDAAQKDLRAVLDEELGHLPPKLRVPLLLCYLDDLTVEETAARLGWSLGTLKTRLSRGRERLRGRLLRRGLGMPAALGLTLAPPDALLAATTRLGMLTSAGSAAAASSPHVVGLAGHALQAMAVAQWKVVAAALAVLAALGLGWQILPALLATNPVNDTQQVGALNDDPQVDAALQPGADLFGDPLPAGALLRLGTLRFRQGDRIVALSLSADGKSLITCGRSYRDTAHVWDAVSGRELRRLVVKNEDVSAAAFSPTADLIALGGGHRGKVFLFDGTGKKLRDLEGPKQQLILQVVFSPDGKLLAAVYQYETLRVWDVATGNVLPQFEGKNTKVAVLAFSPDGKILAAGGYDYAKKYFIRLWDVAGGQELRQLHGHPHGVIALAFSPDGKYLASGAGYYDDTMRLWEVETGNLIHAFGGHDKNHGVRAVAFSNDGTELVSTSEVTRVWDVAGRKELRRMPPAARHVALSRDVATLYAADEGAVSRWDLKTGRPLDPYQGHDASLGHVVCSPDGRLTATRDHEGGLRVWETVTGKEVRRLHSYYMCNVAFSPDGKLLATAGVDDKLKYEVKSGQGRAIMTGMQVRLWDTATWREAAVLPSHKGQIGLIAFLDNGKSLATLDRYAGTVRFWDLATRRETRQFQASKGDNTRLNLGVTSAAVSPDGKRLAVGEEPAAQFTGLGGTPVTIRVWDLAAGKELYELQGHRNQVMGLAFAPNGRILASCGVGYYNAVHLWDAATGRPLRQAKTSAWGLAFSADGAMLATAGYDDGFVRVWDVSTGAERCRFQGHVGRLYGVAFTPDGRGAVSASADTTALVWDVTGMRKEMTRLPARKLTTAERDEAWAALAGADGVKLHRAIWALAADPATPTFLKAHLQPVPRADERRIDRLIQDLDSADFAVRDKATRELEGFEAVAAPALRQALQQEPVLEKRRRIEMLLERADRFETAEATPRIFRAIQVLEYQASPEAVALLQALAQGDPRGRLTAAVSAALARLKVAQRF